MAIVTVLPAVVGAIDNGPGVLAPISIDPPGSRQEGALLSAGAVVGDPDGAATITGYQWYRNGVAVDGATSASYATSIAAQDAGSWSVDVTYVDQQGFTRTLTSAAIVLEQVNNGTGSSTPITTSGPAQEGVTLVAGSITGDPDGNGQITGYQWYLEGQAIAGARDSTYTVPENVLAAATGNYTVRIFYNDGQGYASEALSEPLVVQRVDNGISSLSPIVTDGPLVEGVTLKAGSLGSDLDGATTITGYQWFRDGVAITGALQATYTTGVTDTGIFSVAVTYLDAQGFRQTVTTDAILRPDQGSGSVTAITPDGDPVEGVLLSAGTVVGDPDGNGVILSYQWLKNGLAVEGATGATVKTSASDAGAWSVAITYRDDQGYESTIQSAAITVGQVDNGVAGNGTISYSGPLAIGTVLSALPPSGDPDGDGSISGFQWQRWDGGDWVAIDGASQQTLEITAGLQGLQIRVLSSVVDGQQYGSSIPSEAVTVPLFDDGAGVLTPIVSSFAGVIQPGVILSAGVVTNDPDGDGPAIGYQWYRNNTLIEGATDSTYAVLAADAGQTLTVGVTYADGEGAIRMLRSEGVAVQRDFLATQAQTGLQFGETQLGYAFIAAGAPPLQVSYQGAFVSASVPGNGWEAIAMASDGAGYDLYWSNPLNGLHARWDLDASGAYTAGQLLSSSELLIEENRHQLDIDGDGNVGTGFFTTQALVGMPRFGSTELGYAFEDLNGSIHQISFAGQFASASKPGNGWSAVTLLSDGSGYDLYWQKGTVFGRWDLDASGAMVSATVLTSAQLLAEETRHVVDIDGDGSTGVSSLGLASVGGLELGTTQLGYSFGMPGQGALHVTYRGDFVSESNPGSGWRANAVAADGNGYDLYWTNDRTGASARWDLDASGSYVSGSILSRAALLAEETRHALDINEDGSTGVVVPAGESIGGVQLSSTQIGYAIRGVSGNPVHVSYEGGFASQDMPGAGWQAVAAAQDGAGYDLYWSNTTTGQVAHWELDASGVRVGGSLLSAQQLTMEETRHAFDINRDGITGIPFTSITTVNGIAFGRTALGYALKDNGANPIHVTYGGAVASASNPGQNWEAIAALQDGNGFDLYWRNTVTNVYGRWDLDADGARTGAMGLNAEQLLAEETKHVFDINGNGLTGIYGVV